MNISHLIDGCVVLTRLYPDHKWSRDEDVVYGPPITDYKDYEDAAPDHNISEADNLHLRTLGWWIDDGQWVFYL